MFLLIADGWLRVYEDQYALMGNARVMLAKAVWDTAAYWAVPGLLYFHDIIRRSLTSRPLSRPWRVSPFSVRTCSGSCASGPRSMREATPDTFVGFYDFDFMRDLHLGMTAGFPMTNLSSSSPTTCGSSARSPAT